MASNLILTTAQAQAVYSAMCALNNIGAVIDVEIPGGCGGTRIQGTSTGSVRVEQRWDDWKSERYPDQDAFAAAYGLHQPAAVAPLLEALKVAQAQLHALSFKDGPITSALERISGAIATATP
ncbi:hypothetical protein ACOTH0_08955 [Achromobacter xylosoxidans]|uniref:hypothetical protein n=1 Tax=Alcaligenes xylosoxydans xylosoxydans TaxID=85698 RepID=UPI0006C1D517|nr:hypothetical protein [Achromobacter xylosoxidans]CUK24043.1 Uncharacterised protein [Achromobacter xylosoxidans]